MDSDPKLDAKLRRLECFDLIERNVLALSAGVQRTMYWDFWHDTTKRDDLMTLMYGKLKFFEYENGGFTTHYPVVDSFGMMSRELRGVQAVREVSVPGFPSIECFEADCGKRGTVLIVWKKGNADTDNGSRVTASVPWMGSQASGVDATGKWVPATVKDGKVSFDVGVAPVYIDGA
jgi:hypothetical protein